MSNLKHIQRILNEYEVSTFNLHFLFTPLIESVTLFSILHIDGASFLFI